MLAVIFLTQISWGTITKMRCPICSQRDFGFRNLAFIVPATHLLKITAHLLVTKLLYIHHYLMRILLTYNDDDLFCNRN